MERYDFGRAQITLICAHADSTLTRQSAAPNGGSARWVVM